MKYPYYFWPETSLPWSACTGKNRKQTLIVSLDSTLSGNLPFLRKILRAVDLDFDQDIHFLSAPDNLKTQLLADPRIESYRTLVLFGIRPSQMGMLDSDSSSSSVRHFERLTCITAPALSEIESQPEHKKLLWSVLKQVFQTQDTR